ncbi:MAG TPA: immunoglobulin domain-containing protein [Verrucomicrobiota bacterium]|nr:immunoglobulin domain-containing protein [Verrucomicrobiota bacterium]
MSRLPLPQLVLSALLQLLPLVRIASSEATLATAPIVAILRVLLGAAAVAGSLHAVSGASITVRQPPNSAVRATNGILSAFRLDVEYSDGETTLTPSLYVAENLPPGFNPPAKSGSIWRISGTPTQSGVFKNLKVTAYKKTPIDASDQESTTIVITITVVDGSPVITTQPHDMTAEAGGSASFSVAAIGGNLTYQWRKDDLQVTGATGPTLMFDPVRVDDAGTYQVFVRNSGGGVLSSPAVLSVTAPTEPPTFTTVPKTTAAHLGEAVTLTSAATGPGPLSFQWSKSGQTLIDRTEPSLSFPEVGPLDGGTYTVAVTGPGGTTVSPPAELSVAPALRISAITPMGSGFRIIFNGIVGRTYVLQTAEGLHLPTWEPVAEDVATPESSFSVPTGVSVIRNYRVEAK